MSRLSKESRIAIYKEAIRILNDPDCDEYDRGLCFVLQYILLKFYKKEGVEDVQIWTNYEGVNKVYLDEVMEDFPELVSEATIPLDEGYWWNNDEERLVALHNAIETLEKEDAPKDYSKTLVVSAIIVAVVALFYIVKIALSNA